MLDISVKYAQLQSLLAAQQWRAADWETRQLILEPVKTQRNCEGLSKRDAQWLKKLDYLREADIPLITANDLWVVDQLWTECSNGHFGFTVQVQIWQEVGQDYGAFGNAVGWRRDRLNWRRYWELTFSLDAPRGQFPACPFFITEGLAVGWPATIATRFNEWKKVEF